MWSERLTSTPWTSFVDRLTAALLTVWVALTIADALGNHRRLSDLEAKTQFTHSHVTHLSREIR